MPKKEIGKEKRVRAKKARPHRDEKKKNSSFQSGSSDEVINPLEKYTRFLRTQYLRNIKNVTIYLFIALVLSLGLSKYSLIFSFHFPLGEILLER